MKQLLPHSLWLGHAADGENFKAMLDHDIQALIQISIEEPALQPPRELIYCRFPLIDGPGNDAKLLKFAGSMVASLLEKRVPTLVVCGSGLSRGPAVAAAALSMVYQEPPEDCLKKIADATHVDVDPGLWNDFRALLEEDRL